MNFSRKAQSNPVDRYTAVTSEKAAELVTQKVDTAEVTLIASLHLMSFGFIHFKQAVCSLPDIIFKHNQAHILFCDTFFVMAYRSGPHKVSPLAYALCILPIRRQHWEQI